MLNKIVLGALLVGLIGFLVAGAVCRTLDRAGNVAEARGLGGGQGGGFQAGQGYGGGGHLYVGEQASQGGAAYGQQGGYGGAGRVDAPGDGTGTGQAQVDEWLTLQGSVVSVDGDLLVVQTDNGEITIENRPWWFAQEQGFSTQTGDQVTMVGFYEDGIFEVGQLTDLTTGQTASLRDKTGRPMWAGRGRRGG
jgi:hypothetical protein